jgi:hypothetical protein
MNSPRRSLPFILVFVLAVPASAAVTLQATDTGVDASFEPTRSAPCTTEGAAWRDARGSLAELLAPPRLTRRRAPR